MSTERLDQLLDIFKVKPTHKRAKLGKVFTLYVNAVPGTPGACEGILQGPRGKTVATFWGDELGVKDKARAHVARVPGATLTIYND